MRISSGPEVQPTNIVEAEQIDTSTLTPAVETPTFVALISYEAAENRPLSIGGADEALARRAAGLFALVGRHRRGLAGAAVIALLVTGAATAVGKGPGLIVSKYGGNNGRLDSSPRAARMFVREKKRGGSEAARRLLSFSAPMQKQVLRFPEEEGLGGNYDLVPGSEEGCVIDGPDKPLKLSIGSTNNAIRMKKTNFGGNVVNTRSIFVASANRAVKLTFHFEVPAAKNEDGKAMKGHITRTIVPCASILQGAKLGYNISRPPGNDNAIQTAPRGAFYWITKDGVTVWHEVRGVAGTAPNVSTTVPTQDPVAASASR